MQIEQVRTGDTSFVDCPGVLPGSGRASSAPALSQEDFDVSSFTSGNYCVWIQAGYWDYFIPWVGNPYWTIHPTSTYACDGVTETTKDAWFYVTGHTSGTFETNVSQWLPHYNWNGTFCQ